MPDPPAQTSFLAIISIIALVLGPLGSIVAMVAGLSARREIRRSGGRRKGNGIATAAIVLGALATLGWGAFFGLRLTSDRLAEVAPPPPRGERAPARSRPRAPRVDTPPASSAAALPTPDETRVSHVGAVTVVDLGRKVDVLEAELASQVVDASRAGETLLVMTTRGDCDPCRGVDAALSDPLMQTALEHVRLVRLDIDTFAQDLAVLKMPYERYPAFFLVAADGRPRDGIDGGEWNEDVARNIAPVLGAFVRGTYATRRETWHAPRGTGVAL